MVDISDDTHSTGATGDRKADLTAAVTLEDRNADAILAVLKEHGLCIIPRYHTLEFVDAIKTRCIPRAEVPEDMDFEDGSYRRYDCYQGSAAAPNKRVYHVDCFCENAEQFKHDPLLTEVCSRYYDSPHSVHVCLFERHVYHQIPYRGFHVDTFETSTLKTFLYLDDVALDDGPTSCIVGTHANAELRRLKEKVWDPVVSHGDPSGLALPTNFADEHIADVVHNDVQVVVSAGALAIFDTWGVHRGMSPKREGERNVLVNYFRKGANLPRSDFGLDVKADFKRYHDREFIGNAK